MNVMLISVSERRKEIGIRRTLGERPAQGSVRDHSPDGSKGKPRMEGGARGPVLDCSTLLYRNVVESMDGGVMAIDSGGRIGLFNTGAALLLGLDRAQVQSRAFGEVFVSLEGLEEFSDAVLAAVYDKEVGNRTTVGVRLVDGTERALAVTTVYLVDRTAQETRPSGIVAVFDDVTEIEALRKAEELFADGRAGHRRSQRRHRTAQAEYLEARDRLRELENWEQSPEITRLRRTVARAARAMRSRSGSGPGGR